MTIKLPSDAFRRRTQEECDLSKLFVFQDVLRDETEPPFNLEALKEFAAAQLMEENIEFWIEVKNYVAECFERCWILSHLNYWAAQQTAVDNS